MKTMEKIGMLVLALTLVFAGVMTPGQSFAADSVAADIPSKVTLFRNVNIFDGKRANRANRGRP